MKMIDSKAVIEFQKAVLKQITQSFAFKPVLAVIQVEGDSASDRYIRNKIKLGEELGIEVRHILLNNDVEQVEMLELIDELNDDRNVNGIILQLPIPDHLNKRLLLDRIDPEKDVDGLGAQQIGWLGTNDDKALVPCTAKGVMHLINATVDDINGLDIVIVNCSYLIGIPLQTMLRDRATVTICHELTENLQKKMRAADIVITGIGQAKYFDRSYTSNGQIIIDCSMNFDENGNLCGDYDLDSIKSMSVKIASGPGHTGPLTVLSLMYNTIEAFIKQNTIKGA